MKKGQLSDTTFYFKEPHRFSDKNYILAVRDSNSNTNVISILYFDKKVIDIDGDMGDKIWTVPNKNIVPESPTISTRFLENELIKINNYHLVENLGYLENENYPKSKIFNNNLNPLTENEIIEIFEGTINEETAVFELKEIILSPLIKELYLETNNSFFLIENDNLKGPFKIKNIDDAGKFIVEKSTWKVFGIYEFSDKSYIEFEANSITRRIIIPSFNELNLIGRRVFESNVELIRKFELELKKNPDLYSVEILNKALDLVKKVSQKIYFGDSDRQNRLITILSSTESQILTNLNVSEVLPEIVHIKKEITNLEQEKHNLINEISKIESSKISKEKQKQEIESEYDKLNAQVKDLEKYREDELAKKKIELEYEIETLELKKNQIDNEIEIERIAKSKELSTVDVSIKEKRIIERDLDNTIEGLKKNFKNEQENAQAQLIELVKQKIHFDFISGRDLSKNSNLDMFSPNDFQIVTEAGKDNVEKYERLRSSLISVLEKNNRKFSSHFIDNILISIHQNTLTLFAGLPGTGKTSLVKLLMNILSPPERIREIAVGRGWTSQKDLIGFFNPLSKKFHSSSTNLYSLLKQLDWERAEGKFLDAPLAYVLLDEANLSPLEHYWSVFYNLTDSYTNETSGLKINLGDSEKIEYSNNLRFVGTINYDQTTEELSPRVIDRVNIIRMDNHKSFDINRMSGAIVKNINFTFKECVDIFELIDYSTEQNISLDEEFERKFEEEFERKFEEIKCKFEDLKIFISPRVQIAIKQYCKIAKKIMKEQNKPLDYCIAQRLLPLIRIQGSGARKKLQDLKQILDDNKYEISSKLLSEIIQIGGEEGGIFQDNYNYFLTLSHV